MARYLTLATYGSGKKGKRRKTIKSSLKTGPVTLAIVTVVLTCFVALMFLRQVFDSSTKGFEITELQQQIDGLEQDNARLEIEAAKLKSFENLEDEAKKLNMEPTKAVVYLTRTGAVATAQ